MHIMVKLQYKKIKDTLTPSQSTNQLNLSILGSIYKLVYCMFSIHSYDKNMKKKRKIVQLTYAQNSITNYFDTRYPLPFILLTTT